MLADGLTGFLVLIHLMVTACPCQMGRKLSYNCFSSGRYNELDLYRLTDFHKSQNNFEGLRSIVKLA